VGTITRPARAYTIVPHYRWTYAATLTLLGQGDRPQSVRAGLAFAGGSGEPSLSKSRSNESRQICDHVSSESRRASNSFLSTNARLVIIASRFSTFGSGNLKT